MSNVQKVAIASDHGGRQLKAKVIAFLESKGIKVSDFGVPTQDDRSVDYPDYAAKVSQAVASGDAPRGILICGTGIGMSIAANKFAGIRATLVTDEFTARMSREHNDSNVLCLGERVLNHDRAIDLVQIWLETTFADGRHQSRLDKIQNLERQH